MPQRGIDPRPFCFTTSDLAFAGIEPIVSNLLPFNFLHNKQKKFYNIQPILTFNTPRYFSFRKKKNLEIVPVSIVSIFVRFY